MIWANLYLLLFSEKKKNKIDINKSKAELSGLTYVKNFNYMID